ncbi:MAG: lycopene beta-cyclase CrtY [Methyloligellaceae bacterium]
MSDASRHDLIFVGGGLANTLAAFRLKALRPSLRILLLERGARLGGQHTWSFHTSDLSGQELAWLGPFIVQSWPRQEVRFPEFSRVLEVGYHSITSERLHAVASAALADCVWLETDVARIAPDHVVLADGRRLEADCVIDGRGMTADTALALGYQKFIGLEVRVAEGHGERWPVIMDATVPQRDGYRFVYTLPLADDRILIEDTYYSDTMDLDADGIRDDIEAYARNRGWTIAEICAEERGVLPIVLAGDAEEHWRAAEVPRAGLRALLFHQTTSYSLPDAVRLADALSAQPTFEAGSVAAFTKKLSLRRWDEQGFYRRLNRMLFQAAAPDERYRVLQRFYRLPVPLIQRFYAGRLTVSDQARILIGKPPVALSQALACLRERSAWRFARSTRTRQGAAVGKAVPHG